MKRIIGKFPRQRLYSLPRSEFNRRTKQPQTAVLRQLPLV
jgi:hypothetical protein